MSYGYPGSRSRNAGAAPRNAGDASSTPQGAQWLVPLLFFGTLAAAVYGMRPETDAEKARSRAIAARRSG